MRRFLLASESSPVLRSLRAKAPFAPSGCIVHFTLWIVLAKRDPIDSAPGRSDAKNEYSLRSNPSESGHTPRSFRRGNCLFVDFIGILPERTPVKEGLAVTG